MVQYQLFSQLRFTEGFLCLRYGSGRAKTKTRYCECEATSLEFEKQRGQRAISSRV